MFDDAFHRKVIGIMRISAVRPITLAEVNDKIRFYHHNRQIGEISRYLFEALEPIEILNLIGVKPHDQ